MFFRILRTASTILLIAVVLCGALPAMTHANPSATLNLTPATINITQGASVTLTIKVAAGANQITGAQACLTYDNTKLSAGTPDTSSSALGYPTPSSSSDCTAGEIQVSRFDFTPVSGTFILATIAFTATSAQSVVTNINFDNATSYVKDNVTTDGNGNFISILSSSSGSSLTLNPVAAPTPPTPPTSPPPPAPTTPATKPTKAPAPPTPSPVTTTPKETEHQIATIAQPNIIPAPPPVTKVIAAPTSKPNNTPHYIIGAATIAALLAICAAIKFALLPFLTKRKLATMPQVILSPDPITPVATAIDGDKSIRP
jgi:hypothetical protein